MFVVQVKYEVGYGNLEQILSKIVLPKGVVGQRFKNTEEYVQLVEAIINH